MNELLNSLNKGEGNININLLSDEVKQALANVLQNNTGSLSINNQGNSNSNIKSYNKSNININNINKADNNKSISKNKEKENKKRKKNKSKKKVKNQTKTLTENNEIKNQDLILNSVNNNLDNENKSIDFNDNFDNDIDIDNDELLKTPSNKKNNINPNGNNKEKELNKSNQKKSILSLKNNQSQNNLTKTEKANKNVRFSVPRQSLFNSINNNVMKNPLKANLDSEFSNNESFIDLDSPKRYKTNLDLRQHNNNNNNHNTHAFPFDNINNESFLDENDIKDIHNIRKYSTKTTSVARKTTRTSLIESLSKIRKKRFQKTRKDKSKNKNLVTLKNEEGNKNKNGEEIVDIREEMLNRKLKNFFGKIKMLKNADINNYDEQLKMFIDNEIDKLNDWETKEQEMRINNFFSDLRLIKHRATVGGDIKYANPIKFSSTWTNFPIFKKNLI